MGIEEIRREIFTPWEMIRGSETLLLEKVISPS
jgi:hypothetical protein